MLNSAISSVKYRLRLSAILAVMVCVSSHHFATQLAAQPPATDSPGANATANNKATGIDAKQAEDFRERVRSEVTESQFLDDLAKAKAAKDPDAALKQLVDDQRDAGKPAAAIVAAIDIRDDELHSQILAQQQGLIGRRPGVGIGLGQQAVS